MSKLLFFVLTILCFGISSAPAQSSQISVLAGQIQESAGELADRSAQNFFSRANNSREQVNDLLVTTQLRITIEAFLLLLKNNRPASELREAAEALEDRVGRISNESNRTELQQLKKNIEELQSELRKNDSVTETKKPNKNGEFPNKIYWQGTIDDEVHLIIRNNIVQTKTISGTEYNDAIFNFTSPLPEQNVQISVNKKEGRGTVKVIQQPDSANNFTAIIQILDKSGGAKEYILEISWTR